MSLYINSSKIFGHKQEVNTAGSVPSAIRSNQIKSMIHKIVAILGSLGLFLSLCLVESHNDQLNEIQEVLDESLAKIRLDQRLGVENYTYFIDDTLKVPEFLNGHFRDVLIMYRDSRARETTETEEGRNNLFDFLEDSCRAVIDGLETFASIYSKNKRKFKLEIDESSEIAKWFRARWACKMLLCTYSRGSVENEKLREMANIGEQFHQAKETFDHIRGLKKPASQDDLS